MPVVEKKVTNFVVVVDYKEGQTLEDCYLLGWNNKYDWFDCDTCGYEITTPTGRVKKNKYGLIEIDRWVSVYVGETESNCKDYSDSGNNEGYNCTVCRLEKTEDDWNLIPV
jgi:hypothetical protein